MEKPRKSKRAAIFTGYVVKLLAVFIAYAFKAIASGTIVGVPLWKSAAMAGLMGLVTVGEFLARSAIVDGVVSRKDLDAALAKTQADLDATGDQQ